MISNYNSDNTRRGRLLGVRGEVLQRTNAVFPREIALEVGLEHLEAVAVHHAGAVPGNVEAWRVRLVNDEGIRHDNESESTFIISTSSLCTHSRA